jgi:hypothetical protein
MNKPSDYLAIRFWGVRLGSFSYYIKREQERAAIDNAPLNAIYYREDVGWRTLDDVTNENVIADAKRAGIMAGGE